MPTIGQYKGIDINPGTDVEIQEQMKTIDSGSSTTTPITTTKAEPTIGSILSPYTGSSKNNIYDDSSYYSNLAKTGSPLSSSEENKIRQKVLAQYQGEIDAAKSAYASLLKDTQTQGVGRLGETTAMNARSGLLGSDFGSAQTEKTRGYNLGQEKGVLESQSIAIGNIMARANAAASAEIAARRNAKTAGYAGYQEYLSKTDERKNDTIKKIAKSFITSNLNPSNFTNDLNKIVDSYKKGGMKISTQEIIDSYLEELDAQEQAKIDANAPFELGEGQARYVYNPETGGYERIAFNPKTYKGTGGSGSNVSNYNVAGTEENTMAKDWAKAITEGRAKITDIPASEKGLRSAVARELASPQITQAKKDELQSTINLVDEILGGDYTSNVGLKNIFTTYTPGTDDQGNRAKIKQLSGILSLNNREKLKGSGAISDFEFKVLSDAASSLGLTESGRSSISDKAFADELAKIKKVLQDRLDSVDLNTPQGGDEFITVISPDGQEGTIPAEDLEAALEEGYRQK